MAIVALNTNPSTHELRRFGMLAIPIACALAAALLYWRDRGPMLVAVFLAVGVVSFMVGWRQPRLLRPVFVGGMIASYPFAWLLSHLLMAAMFFLVIVPVGLLLRLAGRDALERKLDPAAKSYWKPRDAVTAKQTADPGRYFRQF